MEQKKTTIIQSKAKCPTCGSDVRVEGTDEGTHYYVPVSDPQREDGFLKALDEMIAKRAQTGYNAMKVLHNIRDLYLSTLTKK